jgi:hypothetical protein
VGGPEEAEEEDEQEEGAAYCKQRRDRVKPYCFALVCDVAVIVEPAQLCQQPW